MGVEPRKQFVGISLVDGLPEQGIVGQVEKASVARCQCYSGSSGGLGGNISLGR